MKNTNPKRGDPAYEGNCTSCAIAAFMRMCGFDVRAGKVRGGQGQSLITAATRCFDFDNKTNVLRGNASEFGTTPEQTAQNLVEKFGKNASGVIAFNLRTSGDNSIGHAFNFKIENGIIEFFDTQEPKINLNDSVVRKIYWPRMMKDLPFEAVRLDNAEPIFEFLELELEH